MKIHQKRRRSPQQKKLLKLQSRNLRAIRGQSKLSQAEFAKSLSIGKSTYANYERGERFIKSDIVEKIRFEFQADVYAKELGKIWAVLDKFPSQGNPGVDKNPPPSINQSRPKSGSPNAFRCADCNELEYVSRDYCRCGAYLYGQLQDRAYKWMQEAIIQIDEQKEWEQSRLDFYRRPAALTFTTAIVIALLSLQFNWGSGAIGFIFIGVAASGLAAIPIVRIEKRMAASEASKEELTIENYIALGIFRED